ncbi:uncharacterized protein ARMOST_12894 [Armillaria ostoyae]|uniref:Uncharacterized protein n=1 Tax=Armillaria ostoyae TaxID=47428 RepID=A0A284RL87_ARMOS|nr:uncharacterized protein ARMOST_12894 [Armillaria ostoyae]
MPLNGPLTVADSRLWEGFKGMDPATIPQFKEGDEEMVVRRLLEEEASTIWSLPLV